MNLPVASAQTLRARTVELARRHRRALAWVVVLHGLAAAAGLLGPWLLGTLVDAVVVGTSAAAVDGVAVVLLAAVLAQTVLTRWAQRGSMTLGETVFADLREEFVAGVTALPLSVVEQAGTGDLLARTTNDVDRVQYTVRFGVPRVVVAVATVLLTVVAAVLVSPALAPAMLAGAPLLVVVSRWYLRRARPAYLREAAAYARLGGSVTESVEGARTVDALGLGARRRRRVDADVDECVASERASLRLRTVLFPAFDLSFVVPLVVVLAWGAHLVGTGTVAVGDVATVALYTVALAGPVGELIFWLDEIQVGATALARITGVRDVTPDRTVGTGTLVAGAALITAAALGLGYVAFGRGSGSEPRGRSTTTAGSDQGIPPAPGRPRVTWEKQGSKNHFVWDYDYGDPGDSYRWTLTTTSGTGPPETTTGTSADPVLNVPWVKGRLVCLTVEVVPADLRAVPQAGSAPVCSE